MSEEIKLTPFHREVLETIRRCGSSSSDPDGIPAMLPWLMIEANRRRYQKTLRFLALQLLIGYDEKQQLLWVLKRGEQELFRAKSTEPY